MKTKIKWAISVLLIFAAAGVMAAGNNSAEYKKAYSCAMDALKNGGDVLGECGYGNAADPSKTEERAWKNAERDYKKSRKASKNTGTNSACTFSYAIWEANGSRSDEWREGPQKETTLKKVAKLAYGGGRTFTFYDASGRVIHPDIANRWFTRKGQYEVIISDEAKKTCSAKQRG